MGGCRKAVLRPMPHPLRVWALFDSWIQALARAAALGPGQQVLVIKPRCHLAPRRPIPGSINPSTGTEMLAWKPEERIASVVAPGGKGMKEERMTFNASQRRPIPEPVRTSWYY